MGATKGNSGVEDHIEDFETHFNGKHRDLFVTNLIQDIKNIIEDKSTLGILKNIASPNDLDKFEIEFVFLFHPNNNKEIELLQSLLGSRYELILIDDDNYKL